MRPEEYYTLGQSPATEFIITGFSGTFSSVQVAENVISLNGQHGHEYEILTLVKRVKVKRTVTTTLEHV